MLSGYQARAAYVYRRVDSACGPGICDAVRHGLPAPFPTASQQLVAATFSPFLAFPLQPEVAFGAAGA